MTDDDLPIIQLPPGPTDAELEAERDAKHEAEVARWFGVDKLAAGLTAGAVAFVGAQAAEATPIVGAQGLTPNARALADYITETYPGVQSIGGVRACDSVGDHCRGVALDVMIGDDMALGDRICADIHTQTARFGVRYTMWRVARHFDHIHITVEG